MLRREQGGGKRSLLLFLGVCAGSFLFFGGVVQNWCIRSMYVATPVDVFEFAFRASFVVGAGIKRINAASPKVLFCAFIAEFRSCYIVVIEFLLFLFWYRTQKIERVQVLRSFANELRLP